jgi:hypothetical protein
MRQAISCIPRLVSALEYSGQKSGAGRGNSSPMAVENTKGFWRTFWDIFVLFSGVSTASNLSLTQGRAVRRRGLFLFRGSSAKDAAEAGKP